MRCSREAFMGYIYIIAYKWTGLGVCSFAPRSFALVAILTRATGVNRSCHSLPKERLEQNEQMSRFTFLNARAIHSLWKSDSLFLKTNCSFFSLKSYQLGWQKCLCCFKFIALLTLLNKATRAKRSFKKSEIAIRFFSSKNKQFARKTKERSPNPANERPLWNGLYRAY